MARQQNWLSLTVLTLVLTFVSTSASAQDPLDLGVCCIDVAEDTFVCSPGFREPACTAFRSSIYLGDDLTCLELGLQHFNTEAECRAAIPTSTAVEADMTLPDLFLIEPAYPNPFNPSTSLSFTVAVEQQVKVTLINSAGQSMRTLYSGIAAPNEMHELKVEADGLPSGTYLVLFEGNGLSATERIVLAK